jgi:Flp pilus assembly protein TadG
MATRTLRHMRNAIRKLKGSSSGSAITIFALLTPVLIGSAGLSVDVVSWYLAKRQLQSAVDGAAVAGTHVLGYTGSVSEAKAAAQNDFAQNAPSAVAAATITVSSPPTSGAYAGDVRAVEVTLNFAHPLHFAKLALDSDVNIATRAVGKVVSGGPNCVLALDETVERAIEFTGSADVSLDCGIMSNSGSSESVYIGGNANLTADPAAAVGDIMIGGSSTFHTNHPPQPLSLPATDPYGTDGVNLQATASGPCLQNNYSVNGTETLLPGRYCGGIRFQGGANVTMQPGVYYMDGGTFKSAGGSTITGTGVSIVLTGSGTDYANLDIAGGSTLALSAPIQGQDYAGVLFSQDRNAPSYSGSQLITNKLLGGSGLLIEGVLYFPSQAVEFTGGSSGSIGCLKIIAKKVKFSGSAKISSSTCTLGTGVVDSTTLLVRLVE